MFTDAPGIKGDYHEYAFSSKFDRDGDMWILLTLTASVDSSSPLRGFGLRVAPDGTATPVVRASAPRAAAASTPPATLLHR